MKTEINIKSQSDIFDATAALKSGQIVNVVADNVDMLGAKPLQTIRELVELGAVIQIGTRSQGKPKGSKGAPLATKYPEAVKLLQEGKNRQEVAELTGLGEATVQRIRKELKG